MFRYLLLSISCLLLLTACGGVGKDVAMFLNQTNPKSCLDCDLNNANLATWDLTGADLKGADLSNANLTGAILGGARMEGVIGADFSGALNVPDKYLKD